MTTSNSEDPYAFLTSFDKIFVIDDNGNMVGRSWQEFQSSLLPTTSTCTVHDAEDVGIDSLNHQSPYTAVQSPENILGCSNLDLSFTSPEPGEGIFIEEDEQDWPSPSIVFKEANKLAAECDAITTRRYSDANFLPYLNVRLSFEKSISQKYLQEPGSVSYVTSWLLHSLTGTDNKLWDKWNRRNGEHTLKASFEKNCYQRIPWSGSSEGGGIGPETDWHSSDVPWKKGIDGNRTTQQGYCSHIPLLFMVPKQFLCLAILASIIVPVISADTPFYYVDAAAWAFAILANVPSLYVLANPTLLPGGNGHAEDIIWKVARGWSVSIGPVFAAVLVMLLRTKLPSEKREAFLILVFVISVVGMLILMLSMRDGTLSVLNLLALCVSWCAIASYMTVNGLRSRALPLNAHAV